MNNYDDIINLPHHISQARSRMSLENRAFQFAPFSALSGYEDKVKEVARLTDEKKELADGLKEMINERLNYIKNNISKNWLITVTYFVKDEFKDGGKYENYQGIVRRIDEVNGILYFKDKKEILIEDIINIS